MTFFRPHPIMTLFALGGLIMLSALGWWQLERLAWKLDLIAAVELRADSAPVPLDEVLALRPQDEWAFTPVIVAGQFDHAREAYVFGLNLESGIGWFVYTPLLREGQATVIVNRGWVPEDLQAPSTRPEGQVMGAVELSGLVRDSASPGTFTPPPNIAEREWFTRDHAGIAAAMGLEDMAPVFVDAARGPVEGALPRGGQTPLHFTNSHLGYAITWFGLALTLLGVYIAFHWQTGRIGRIARTAEETNSQ